MGLFELFAGNIFTLNILMFLLYAIILAIAPCILVYFLFIIFPPVPPPPPTPI